MKETITQNNTDYTNKLHQLMKEKRYEEALVCAEENLSPDDTYHQIWLAGIYALNGHYDRTREILVSLEIIPLPEIMEKLLLRTVKLCTHHFENE